MPTISSVHSRSCLIQSFSFRELPMFSMKRNFSLAIIGSCLLITASVAQAANAITNGSFETPTVPVGNFTNFIVGSNAIPGWTVVGPAGTSVSIVSTTFSQNNVSFPAQDGAQWVDLTGFNINTT